MNNLATAYLDAGRIDEAITLHEEALKIKRAILDPGDLTTLSTMDGLASAYLAAKRWTEAERISLECLKLRDKDQPGSEGRRFHTMSQLGAALAGQRRYAEAEPLLIQGYEGLERREADMPGWTRWYLAQAVARIVPFYEAWGKPGKAAEWRKKLGKPNAGIDLPPHTFPR
jgi:tetratricopeptide (TPR) repeat protein